MLATNLATRPFYNVRIARLLLALVAVALVALSAVILMQALSLRERERGLTSRASEARAEAARLRDEAERVRGSVDLNRIEAVSAAATEVNRVIQRRVFSWSAMLSEVEGTLPDDLRITAIQPQQDEKGFRVSFTVEAERPEALSEFVTNLERQGSFRDVLVESQQTALDDVIDGVVAGAYVQQATAAGPDDDSETGAVEAPAP
jgi:hypothetical protein